MELRSLILSRKIENIENKLYGNSRLTVRHGTPKSFESKIHEFE